MGPVLIYPLPPPQIFQELDPDYSSPPSLCFQIPPNNSTHKNRSRRWVSYQIASPLGAVYYNLANDPWTIRQFSSVSIQCFKHGMWHACLGNLNDTDCNATNWVGVLISPFQLKTQYTHVLDHGHHSALLFNFSLYNHYFPVT